MTAAREPQCVSLPPAEKPLMIYDGDCEFCSRWIERWKKVAGDRIDYTPASAVRGQFPEIPPEQFKRAVQFVDTDGSVTEGADAAVRALSMLRGLRWMRGFYPACPGLKPLAQWLYRRVARHRKRR